MRYSRGISRGFLMIMIFMIAGGCAPWGPFSTVRPQPSGPDDNFRILQEKYRTSVLSLGNWDSANDTAFFNALKKAENLKPGSQEVEAMRRECQALLEKRRAPLNRLPPGDLPQTYVNSVGMTMRLIKSGSFMMGSNWGWPCERPAHEVHIGKPFYIGVYEITGDQYARVMGGVGGTGPKAEVSWADAMEFCQRLSAKEGVVYSLPTEAQWEYACRAGTSTRYSFGDTWSASQREQPNPWGLYDMHGSVWERCLDWYDGGYYANSPTDDPQGPSSGQYHVLRGGSWASAPFPLPVRAQHHFFALIFRNQGFGFRVVQGL